MARFSFLLVLTSVVATASPTQADTFGSGANQFEIEFVPIGQPGNVADIEGSPNPAGSVPYRYRIGKFEISESMIDAANALGNLGIDHDNRGPDKPATSVSWFEAARFVNWLNEDQGFTPAYKFDTNGDFQLWQPTDPGFDPNNLFRNKLTRYVLPTVDEWYKAAYFDPVAEDYNRYPTGPGIPTAVLSGTDPGTAVFILGPNIPNGPANIMQAGGLSLYGTMAQGGNVTEWQETELDLQNDQIDARRRRRGGAWGSALSGLARTSSATGFPNSAADSDGFRVAFIPEPTTLSGSILALFILATVCRLRTGVALNRQPPLLESREF